MSTCVESPAQGSHAAKGLLHPNAHGASECPKTNMVTVAGTPKPCYLESKKPQLPQVPESQHLKDNSLLGPRVTQEGFMYEHCLAENWRTGLWLCGWYGGHRGASSIKPSKSGAGGSWKSKSSPAWV